jgi:hypothetical protein
MYVDFRGTVSLVFPGLAAIDFAVDTSRGRYEQSETPIDIVSVRAVSKAEYIPMANRQLGPDR